MTKFMEISPLIAPPLVADHEMLQRIGVGAYGEVWLARSMTGTFRAVKVVSREQFDHERTFEREFAGLKKFEPVSRSHDGLVDILQVGRDDAAGYFYYVMELADNIEEMPASFRPLTLAELIQRRGRLSVKECSVLGASLAGALGFLHAQGLVHRDVKPANIIFVEGRAKLADIGLVASLGDARSFVGTEGFIPPEGPGSPRADLFAFGKMLYEMATGKNRLDFPDLPVELQGTEEAAAFSELNETILRACASAPEHRHESAEELRGELLLLDAGGSIRRLRRNERMMAVWRRVGLAASVLVLAVAAGLFLERRRTEIAREAATAEARQRRAIAERELAALENLYAADMNLAQQAIIAGNYGRAEALLAGYGSARGGQDLRGFEWFYFWNQVRGDSVGTLRGHDHVVAALSLSPDGQRLFSASFDTTIREWSIAERRELRRWSLPSSLFGALALDPGGRLLAGEGGNRPCSSLLDLETGLWITNVSSASPSVAFTPDGRKLARGAKMLLFETNGVVEITDLSFKVERVLPEAGGRLQFSHDGKLMATGPAGDAIRLWSWPKLAPLETLPGAGTVMAMSFSPDDTRLASVSRDGRLCLWDIPARSRLAEIATHGGSVIWSVAYSPDGKRIATGGSDQTVRTWNASTLAEEHVFRGHGSEVWAVLWSPDGRQIFSGSKDTSIRVWDGTPRPEVAITKGVVQRPLFSPDERYVAARLRTGGVVLEAKTGAVTRRLEDAAEIGGFSADGRTISILRQDWMFQRRVLADGAVVESRQLEAPADKFNKRLLSGDGRWLITGLQNGDVFVHDTRVGGKATRFSSHKEMIVALAVSADNGQLLTGSMDRTARLWDLATGNLLHVFDKHRMAVGSVVFSRDNALIATGSWDDTVHVWDGANWAELAVLSGHEGGVQAVDFTPDNRTLISLTGTSALKLWSLPAEREAGMLQLPQGVHQGWLAVSPGGHWLAAVSQAEVLTLLPAPRDPMKEVVR